MADDIVTKGAKRVKIHYQVPVSKDSSLPNSCWKLGEVSRPLQACWSWPGGGEGTRRTCYLYTSLCYYWCLLLVWSEGLSTPSVSLSDFGLIDPGPPGVSLYGFRTRWLLFWQILWVLCATRLTTDFEQDS